MSANLLFVLFIILSYAGVALFFKRKNISLLGGMEYIFVGFAFSLLDMSSGMMRPLLYVFLGWIGLLTGSQLQVTYLRGLTRGFYVRVLFFVLLTLCCICLPLLAVLSPTHAVIAAIALTPVSYRTVAHFIRDNRYILFFVSIVPVFALCAFGLFYFFQLDFETICLLVLFAGGYSIISRFVLSRIDSHESMTLMLIGFIILISESCAVLNISPLLVGFGVGMYLANFCPLHGVVFSTLYKDEKQLYMMFLLLAGMVAGFDLSWDVVQYTVFATGLAAVVKWALARQSIFKLSSRPARYFIPPGAFSVCIAIDFWLFEGATHASAWLTSLILTVVALQFISVLAVKKHGQKIHAATA